MAEFKCPVDVVISDPRAATRNPYTEGLLALRAVVVEATDEVQATVRANQIVTALTDSRVKFR